MFLYLAQVEGARQASPFDILLPMGVLFIIMYFLLIRPQKTKEKKHREMVSQLKKNDAVITSGGVHGTIVNVKEKTVIVRIDESVKIEVQRSSIIFAKKKDENNED